MEKFRGQKRDGLCHMFLSFLSSFSRSAFTVKWYCGNGTRNITGTHFSTRRIFEFSWNITPFDKLSAFSRFSSICVNAMFLSISNSIAAIMLHPTNRVKRIFLKTFIFVLLRWTMRQMIENYSDDCDESNRDY